MITQVNKWCHLPRQTCTTNAVWTYVFLAVRFSSSDTRSSSVTAWNLRWLSVLAGLTGPGAGCSSTKSSSISWSPMPAAAGLCSEARNGMSDAGIPCQGSSAYRSCNHVQCLCWWWYTYSPGKPQGRWLIGDEQWLLLSDTLSMVAVLNGTFYDFSHFSKNIFFFATTPFWMICAPPPNTTTTTTTTTKKKTCDTL